MYGMINDSPKSVYKNVARKMPKVEVTIPDSINNTKEA